MRKIKWVNLEPPMELSVFMTRNVGKKFKIVSTDKATLSAKVLRYRQVRGTLEIELEQ